MVNKLTNNVKPLDEVDKINEIIDELDNIDPLPSQTGQSGKYLTTNGTVPSWADVQSLPSQTGKAGLYLQTDGTDASWEGVPGRNIGEIVASTIPLTDAGLHLLDGALINGSGIYSAFVDYIASIYDASANYFCSESDWQTAVTTYGVCGKFVYDSVNDTVRLPKITGILEGTTDVTALGDLVEAGLPNITGNVLGCAARENNTTGKAFQSANGAFSVSGGAIGSTGSMLGNANSDIYFDASNSSSIYGNSSTVQPQTIKAFYYIVIATSTKTDIQVDIDEIATDLNGKADVDLTNCTKPHITETYINGTSWYRVYSDGWCEQGGYFPTASSYGMQTVTFLKPYRDTNYNVLTTVGGLNSSSGVTFYHISALNKTASSFQTTNDDAFDKTWRTCGYIA